jgi:hypothetical protein
LVLLQKGLRKQLVLRGRSLIQKEELLLDVHQRIGQTTNAGVVVVELQPGVDVKITIYGDFSQFLAKNWRFFLKSHCYDDFLAFV